MKNQDIKILLVDDEPDILEILSYNLTAEGYQVFTAKNGAEGVEKARKKHPHLIILDVMMPEMDGIEACEIIRRTEGLEAKTIRRWPGLTQAPMIISPNPSSPRCF